MTKEEIQKGYHDHCKVNTDAPKHLQCPAFYTHDGWVQGAEWANKVLLEKAGECYCKMCDQSTRKLCEKRKQYSGSDWHCMGYQDFVKAIEK